MDYVVDILIKYLPKKAVIAMKGLYYTWGEYLTAFCKVGGIIEASPNCLSINMASPSIAFLIEPSGEVQLTGSLDKFQASQFINGGCFFP
jgi:hypothetical protein